MADAAEEIGHWGRVGVGILGGLLVLVNKVLSQSASGLIEILEHIAHGKDWQFQLFGYGFVALCMVFCCAVVAWFVPETNRLKLVAVAVSAPAMISVWSVPSHLATPSGALAFVQPADAQTGVSPIGTQPIGNDTAYAKIWEGVKLFFNGAGNTPVQRYRVVVASTTNPDDAAKIAQQLHQEDEALMVAVANPAPGNPYFAVLASGFLPYGDANAVLGKVQKLPLGANAYLSAERPDSPGYQVP